MAAEHQDLPSLSILFDQVTAERGTMNAHAESLDTKAGVVLGFSGVLVGLFLPRRYPVLEVARLRQSNLTAPEGETRLELLDTQIVMVDEAATLVKAKGRRVRASVACLAVAAALVVVGTLISTGGTIHA